MEFTSRIAPHLPVDTSVTRVMQRVVLALVPGAVCSWWFFGHGIVINICLCLATALLAEAAVLGLRRRPVGFYLRDYSAVVTAVLLGLALPPLAPWWIAVIGSLFAIVAGKHLYGGLGLNPFNPAMVGYVVLLISFPREMTLWAPPASALTQQLGLLDSITLMFSGVAPAGSSIDALSMATPLDTTRTQLGLNRTLAEIHTGDMYGNYGGRGWEWVNLCYLLGGGWLLYRKTIRWQIPLSMLAALFIMAGIFNTFDPDAYPNPLFHLFSGAAMLGAFFIATDPVSAASTRRGRIFYGVGIGVLVYLIRTWGNYPDAIAFAVLLMNMAAPAIDHYCRPRTFGHQE